MSPSEDEKCEINKNETAKIDVMKSKQVGQDWLLRFEYGDDFISALTNFAESHQIDGGFFHGLGGTTEVSLGFYHLSDKQYRFKELKQPLEVVSLHGNIAVKDDEIKIHAHGVVSDDNLRTYGGHIQKLTVGPTLELFITKIDQKLTRKFDEFTGLDQLEL